MNLKGWDIVSFTPAEHLNRAIAEKSEELSFDIKDGDMLLYGKWACAASFRGAAESC